MLRSTAPALSLTKSTLLPILAAIGRAEDAALLIPPKGMPQRRHKDRVRILRVNANLADVARVFQADMLPAAPGVGGLVNTVAMRDINADRRFPVPA